MNKRIKWMIILIISVLIVLIIGKIVFMKNNTKMPISYVEESYNHFETSVSEEDSAIDKNEIDKCIKKFLPVFFTYKQLDSSYTAQKISDYCTPDCIWSYLMNKMDGKTPWTETDKMMEDILKYVPSRDYVYSPSIQYALNDYESVIVKEEPERAVVWIHYQIHESGNNIEPRSNNYMAILEMRWTESGWKIDLIRFVSTEEEKYYYGFTF